MSINAALSRVRELRNKCEDDCELTEVRDWLYVQLRDLHYVLGALSENDNRKLGFNSDDCDILYGASERAVQSLSKKK